MFEVYDTGPDSTTDRYTIVFVDQKTKRDMQGDLNYNAVGTSGNPAEFWQHIECTRGEHLGKRISIFKLPLEAQTQLLSELQVGL